MQMLLRPEYLNGHFGDPALYVWEINEKDALLIDCGDLSHFAPKQLLKVQSIFISHCHMDHFFGFDVFLRIHMGIDKTVTLFGPPGLSERLAGKLQGYTWNLLEDQKLEFIAVDLDEVNSKKTTTRFLAQNQFRAEFVSLEDWDVNLPILDTLTYQVKTVTLDHRTPSMAYSIEEKITVTVNTEALQGLGLKAGPWVGDLKILYASTKRPGWENREMDVPTLEGKFQIWKISELVDHILIPRQRHKIAYSTDGAASPENYKRLLKLVDQSDLYLSETCFLQKDSDLADATKHFTAAFIGKLAEEAQVKKVAPFHFSKRYLNQAKLVLDEVAEHFSGEVVDLS